MNQETVYRSLLLEAKKHQLDQDSVDSQYAYLSANLIQKLPVQTMGDAFLIWSAFNYLNFAANKNTGDYSFKDQMEEAVLKTHQAIEKVRFYYEAYQDILYVSFYGFVFSFQKVPLRPKLKDLLSRQTPIAFDGVRKQACTTSILKVAMKNPDLSCRLNPGECPSSSNETDYGERCTFFLKPYRLSDISNDYYHLHELTSTLEMRRNIAIVIRQMYFYCDLATKANPPLEPLLERAIYRDIIILSYSVIQAIEIELGSMILGTPRRGNNPRYDQRCVKALHDVINIQKEELRMYNEYRTLRNNVHLSKKQSIETDKAYTRGEVDHWLMFMQQYLEYLYQCLPYIRKD